MIPASDTAFGSLLRRYRLGAGLSQEALAERAGLSVNAIAALERGRRNHPRPSTLSVLVDALRLEPADRTALLEAGDWQAAGADGTLPLTAPSAPPPAPLTTFVGREPELAELGQRLREVRLVTLTGAGGTGKTRLAAEVCAAIIHDGRGPVWFAPLDACHDPELVAPLVAAAVGQREVPGRSVTDTLSEVLGDSDGLIVLDNCEHLLPAVAAVVQSLLGSCTRLRVLATSRAVLGVPGELAWRVPPLRLPPPGEVPHLDGLAGAEAIRLFVDRAALASAGFRLTLDNAPSVAGICRQLDGIPLAIELAAARVRVLAPAQVLSRLEDACSLLTHGALTSSPRQQTLRATIEWSYWLLESRERTLFDQLSVFSGGFQLEAAEAVAGGDVLGALASLVDQSLVVAEPGPASTMRYRLLEVLRQFGRSRLIEHGDADTVFGRHAEHYLGIARQADRALRRGDLGGALPRLRLEHPNLRASLEWAAGRAGDLVLELATAMGRYWDLTGSVAEGSAWLEEALAHKAEDPGLRATALLRAAQLATLRGNYARADLCLAESLGIKRNQGDTAGIARRMNAMAVVALARGDSVTVERLCHEVLSNTRRVNDRHGMAWAHTFLGWAALEAGDAAGAERNFCQAKKLHLELENNWGLLHDVLGLAVVQLSAGDVPGAHDTLAETVEELGQPLLEGVIGVVAWVWSCLLLASAEGRHRSVARLDGVIRARAGQGVRGVDWYISLSVLARPAVDAAYRELGPQQFELLAAEGSTMSLDDVLEEALARP